MAEKEKNNEQTRKEKEMPFLDHLEELRWRIIKSIISVLLCTIGVYVFSEPFMEILVHPYITARPDDVGGLVYLGPTGGFMVYLEISLFGGIVLSLPVIFYQLWQFVAPGLYKRERKYTLGVIIISTISFFIGATFSYSVIIPLGLNFLLGYKTTFLAPSLTIDKYLSFILMLLLVSGLVFELPLVTFFLTKLGLISAKFMREKRRYAIVIVLIVAAILTPPDVMTQLLLAGPIVVLYEISILVSAIVGRKRRKKEAAEAASPDESHHAQEQSAAEAAAAESEPQREMPETIAATPDISDGKMKADKPKEAESNPQDIMATLAASDLLPDSYKDIPIAELNRRIVKIKRKYGSELAILGHHYQRDEIIAHSDIRGDSFALSKKASELAEAKTIVFCGVKFMAEAACILARPNQIVLHPDFNAGCPLADFADIDKVEEAWDTLISICRSDTITPITYMNSSSEIKAFCGRKSGTVCTSSNAPKAFQWGLEQSNKVFFFPDQHLGENTASKLNLQYYDYVIWDPAKDLGGNSEEAIRNAKLILWKGHCHVHTFFTEKHVQKMRKAYPDAKIVVHPECKKSVVDLVDANGSTDFIINYAKNAPLHSTIIVGTEINLVTRLQRENPDKTIIPLARSLCPNMYKINLQNLYWTLDNLGDVNAVYVEPGIIKDARIALNRMLEIAK